MKLLTINDLENYVKENPLLIGVTCFPKPVNQDKTKIYLELLNYLNYKTYTENSLKELKEILRSDEFIEQFEIKQWILKNLEIFNETFFSFGLSYLEYNVKDDNLYLIGLNEYVDKSQFLSIIQYWESMWLLYFGEYHIDKDKRSLPDKPDTYNTEPTEPSDYEKILTFLNLR